jgi:N-acetylglutamate synthase-like GNAT family acetyltransferase
MDAGALTIRPATAADVPAVLALLAQPDYDDGDVLSVAEAGAVFEKMARYPSYTLYVAERAGAVVGSYALLIMDNLGHRATPSAIVEQVVVAQAAQSGGIGETMMRRAMADAAAAGAYKLVLSSNAKRERAHAFYERLGFTRHGFSFWVTLEPAESAGAGHAT